MANRVTESSFQCSVGKPSPEECRSGDRGSAHWSRYCPRVLSELWGRWAQRLGTTGGLAVRGYDCLAWRDNHITASVGWPRLCWHCALPQQVLHVYVYSEQGHRHDQYKVQSLGGKWGKCVCVGGGGGGGGRVCVYYRERETERERDRERERFGSPWSDQLWSHLYTE